MASHRLVYRTGIPPGDFPVKRVLLFLFLSSSLLCSQERSVVSEILQAFGEAGADAQPKCATPAMLEARRRLNEFPHDVRQGIRMILQRPVRQKSRISPSGFFRIHYDTSGMHQPAALSGSPALRVANSFEEYVDSVAAILDYCWGTQVMALGYEAPPQDGTIGGGPEYDVYVESLPAGLFGYTGWNEDELQFESGARERTTSYIVLDNDYLGYRTEGWNGLRVTAAHEFHHAIQVGSYGIWTAVPNSDFYFYELTAVWMEDALYDDIDDYLFDLPIYFGGFKDLMNRSYSFTEFHMTQRAGYERSVFAHYLDTRFGRQMLTEVWEASREQPILNSLNRVLQRRGSSLSDAFAEFSYWNLFTGSRADPLRYYPEGGSYPALAMNASVQLTGSTSSIQSSAFPLSAQYYGFRSPSDTVVAVVVRNRFEDAYSSPGATADLQVVLSTATPAGGVQILQNGYRSGFLVDRPDEWRTFFVGSATLTDQRTRSLAFPNPLSLSQSEFLILPAEESPGDDCEVFFVTGSFDVSFSGRYPLTERLGKTEIRIPVPHLAEHLATGIHFVVLKTTRREYQWKIAVIR